MTPLGSWVRRALQSDAPVDVASVDPYPFRLLVVSAGVAAGGQLRSWLAGEVDGRPVVNACGVTGIGRVEVEAPDQRRG
jgi:hypothetical protein